MPSVQTGAGLRNAALAAILLASTLLGLQSARPARAEGCTFVLGFATLHNKIQQVVGGCLADETHNPVNGDGLQITANGLLVWRKSDNFTGFTNGYQTWINGPFGLQTRLNSERFFWEQNPTNLSIIPTPVAGQQCHTAGLSLDLVNVDAGAGNRVGTFRFTNNLGVSCTFFGFPGAQLLGDQNNPLPTKVVRNGGYFGGQPGPATVVVPAGGSAVFRIHWEVIEVGNEPTCPTSSQLAVTPPDEFDPLIIPAQIMACGGGTMDITPVLPAS